LPLPFLRTSPAISHLIDEESATLNPASFKIAPNSSTVDDLPLVPVTPITFIFF